MKSYVLSMLVAGAAAFPAKTLNSTNFKVGDVLDEVGHVLGLTFPQTDGTPFELPREVNQWEFRSVEGTQCMDGRETGIHLRRGRDTNKLAIHFAGGGACFNLLTCGVSSTNPVGNPSMGGVFNPDREENAALRDYSFVYVPYCTGDVFLGNAEGNVGGSNRQFRGRPNLNLILQRLVPTFPGLTDLVLSGDSAGGFGAAANFDFVMLGFDSPSLTTSTLIDDAGPILADFSLRPCLQTLWRDVWNLNSVLPPDCPECSNQPDGGGLINYYAFIKAKYPSANLGLISAARDSIISIFFGFGADDCTALLPLGYEDEFEAGLQDAYNNHFNSNLAGFITPGGAHTFITSNTYFNQVAQGMRMYEWVANVMQGRFANTSPWDAQTNKTAIA